MSESSGAGCEIELNGVTMERFNITKHMYHMVHGYSMDNLAFFNFCLETWLNLKPVFERSVQFNMPHLVRVPYCFFRDMVIVGAQTELERLRGRWHCNERIGIQTITYLRGWRYNAASDYAPNHPVLDSEREYYCDIPDEDDTNQPPHVGTEPPSD